MGFWKDQQERNEESQRRDAERNNRPPYLAAFFALPATFLILIAAPDFFEPLFTPPVVKVLTAAAALISQVSGHAITVNDMTRGVMYAVVYGVLSAAFLFGIRQAWPHILASQGVKIPDGASVDEVLAAQERAEAERERVWDAAHPAPQVSPVWAYVSSIAGVFMISMFFSRVVSPSVSVDPPETQEDQPETQEVRVAATFIQDLVEGRVDTALGKLEPSRTGNKSEPYLREISTKLKVASEPPRVELISEKILEGERANERAYLYRVIFPDHEARVRLSVIDMGDRYTIGSFQLTDKNPGTRQF